MMKVCTQAFNNFFFFYYIHLLNIFGVPDSQVRWEVRDTQLQAGHAELHAIV